MLAGAVMAVGAVFWILPGGREDQRIVGAAPPVAARIVGATEVGWPDGVGPMLIQAGRRPLRIIPLIAVGSTSVAEIGASAHWHRDRLCRLSHLGRDHGPLRAAVFDRPGLAVMAIGLVMLGLADDATDVAIASVLIGAGNGVTSHGAVLTLGADLGSGRRGRHLPDSPVSNLGLFSAHSSSAPSPTSPGSMSRPSCSAASCSPVSLDRARDRRDRSSRQTRPLTRRVRRRSA